MTSHREGVWTTGTDRFPCVAFEGRRVVLEVGGTLALAGAVAFFVAPLGSGLLVGLVAFVSLSAGLAVRRGDDRKRALRERAVVLREEFGAGPAWIVDLMVRQGDAPTGCDQGLMWVEGGRILFSGLRTSFALVPSQVAGRVAVGSGIAGLRHRLNLQLARQTPAGHLSISFWPISESLQNAEDDAANLRYALNALLDGRWLSAPPTEGQWPPVTIGPGAPEPKALRQAAVLRVGAWTSVAAMIALGLAARPWIAFGLFVALAAFVNLLIFRENAPRWAAYRDARRIREAM